MHPSFVRSEGNDKPDKEFLRAMAARQRQDFGAFMRHLTASFAQYGNKRAAATLGDMFWEGTGVRQSRQAAIEYYYQAMQATPG